MTAVAFMHWTLSQSVFVVTVETFKSDGSFERRFASIGFSVWPIITGKQKAT